MVNVECSGCGAPYSLSEKRIPDNGLKMRCPKCGESFMVHKPGGPSKVEIPATPKASRPLPRRPKATQQGHAVPTSGLGLGGAPPPPGRAVPSAGAPTPPPKKRSLFNVSSGASEATDEDLSVDGLLQAAERADQRTALGIGGGAGGEDIPGLGDFEEVDDGFGVLEMGLPGGEGGAEADLPMPAMDADLPMPAGGGADLPMPVGGHTRPYGEADLPMALDDGVDLPAARGADLPMAARGADLPTARGGIDLPMPAGDADLPIAADADFPMAMGDDLPMPAGHADLPLPAGEADLPLPGGNLPIPAGHDLPAPHRGGDLPLPSDQDFPFASPTGDLPLPGEGDLPFPSPTGDLPHGAAFGDLPSGSAMGDLPDPHAAFPQPQGELPNPGDFNFPESVGASADDAIPMGDGFADQPLGAPDQDFLDGGAFPAGEADLSAELVSEPPRRGPSADDGFDAMDAGFGLDDGAVPPRRDGGDVGDEFNIDQIDEGPAGARMLDHEVDNQTDAGGAPKVKIKRKRSNRLRIALAVIPLLAIGGGLLSLTPLGPYGAYAISDALNADDYAQRLASFRQASQEQLGVDTASEATALLQRAQSEQAEMTRFTPMKSYTAYLAFQKALRFGADGATLAVGRQLLNELPPDTAGVMFELAKAAQAAADGQTSAAQSMVAALGPRLPNDVDLAVLAGEIALDASDKEAVTKWKEAVAAGKSARTLYGLARALEAADQHDEAQETAEQVLKLSKDHAGARTLLATALWKKSRKDPKAIEMLQEVTKKGPVQQAASRFELVDAHSLLGDIYLSQSKMTAAEKAFNSALKLDPKSERALVGNGELYYQAGRYAEALGRYKAAFQVNPGNVHAAVGRAKSKLALEQAKEAKQDLLAFAKSSKHPLVGYWLGQAHLALGERDEAEKAYRVAIKTGGTHPDVVYPYVALADLLDARDKRAEAEEVLAEATEKLPKSAALYNAKGDVALKAGRIQEAKREFNKALEIEPDNSSSRFRLGVAHRRGGEYELAAKRFDEVSADDPEFPGLALERGLLFEDTGNTDQALKMYADALQKAPDDIDLKLRVASTQVMSGHPEKALPHLKQVIAKRPRSAEVNHFLGRAKLLVGESPQDALRYLETAVRADPNQAAYHLYVAWAANESGQPGVAQDAIEKALEIDKNLGDAYWQKGVLLQKEGRTLDALEELEIALEKNPTRYEAYATMARCYIDQSNLAKAEEAWRKAIEGNKWRPEWQFRLGKILVDRGARDEAAPFLRRAVDLLEERKQTPAWLWNANWLLGEALRQSDPKRALKAYKEFLRLSTSENAYRPDAEKAVDELEERP